MNLWNSNSFPWKSFSKSLKPWELRSYSWELSVSESEINRVRDWVEVILDPTLKEKETFWND